MPEDVIIRDEGAVRYVAIDRPQTRNGLTLDVTERLRDAFRGAADEAAVRCVVLGGDGAFSSGLDLRQPPSAGPHDLERIMREVFHGLARAIWDCPKPTVAYLDGPVAGIAVGLALSCDLRLATERATFAVSFARVGLVPDGGATWLLPRAVGLGKALELMLLAERVDAREAHRLGLVERLVPVAEGRTAVAALAERLAKGPPIVQRFVKEMSRRHLDASHDAALEDEVPAQLRCFRSRDFAEGLTAFLAKREPEFRGD